jgi:UDP-N-acetylglucosamine:LPS N-acetylglucosamine transferase
MELLTLQKKAILIPTPGQTEQEYLAKKLLEQRYCFSIKQADLNLAEQTKLAKEFDFKKTECKVFDPETIVDLLKASV